MTRPMTHEEGLARFLVPDRRGRFLELLSRPKGRKKLRSELAHFRWLDERFTRAIPPGQYNEDGVLRLLRAAGAPDRCHVLSADSKIDGRELDLCDLLSRILYAGAGTFVSCIPGKLAYYEGEDRNSQCILERTG